MATKVDVDAPAAKSTITSDPRQLQDMRGAVQWDGQELRLISPEDGEIGASSAHLQKTYLPVNQAAVEMSSYFPGGCAPQATTA